MGSNCIDPPAVVTIDTLEHSEQPRVICSNREVASSNGEVSSSNREVASNNEENQNQLGSDTLGNLTSVEGIRVIISSLRSSSDQIPPPPSYDEALNPNDLPPPAYESLFGQVQAARRSSEGVADFITNLIILLFGTIGFVACVGLAVVIPFAMVLIGLIYFNECPQENKIPLYLVVGGSVTLLNNAFGNFRVQGNENNGPIRAVTKRSPWKAFVTTFIFIWFILGSIWVYKEYEPSYDPASPNYCNPTLYMFAFWVITSSYLVLMVLSMGICCIAFFAAGLQEQLQQLQ